jgi:phage tail-like protein
VRAILGGLQEPVDVAVSADGRVYVADRAAGTIAVFSARWQFAHAFAAQDPAVQPPQPPHPRPIAVMVEADGTLTVADAHHPRLLRFYPDGTPLPEAVLRTLVAELAGGAVALGALQHAYGARMPRFLVGSCGPCLPGAADGGLRLAEVHRALRLLRLALGQRFAQTGQFISYALDSKRPGTRWHKVEVELVLPPGTGVVIETVTDESPAPQHVFWLTPLDKRGRPQTFTVEVPEQLVQSPPGRRMWLRVTLTSDGTATPSVRAIRAYQPRVTYLDLIPAAYRRDPEAGLFLEKFLALFEHVFTGVEDRFVEFSRELDPDAAPREVIDWLAALIDLAFDPSWPLERRRALVAEAMALYRTRGTVRGLERYVEIYTGVRPLLVESFLERPSQPAFLGRPGTLVGCTLALVPVCQDATPDDTLYARFAHRFTLYVYIDDACDEPLLLRAVDRIVEANKPAHTVHTLRVIRPGAELGFSTGVGMDFVVGAARAPATRLGGGPEPGAPRGQPGVLGVDTVLGERRPEYVQPLVQEG